MFYYDDDDFFSNRSRTLIEAAPEKNWFDFTIEAAAYKRHNTVYSHQNVFVDFDFGERSSVRFFLEKP